MREFIKSLAMNLHIHGFFGFYIVYIIFKSHISYLSLVRVIDNTIIIYDSLSVI